MSKINRSDTYVHLVLLTVWQSDNSPLWLGVGEHYGVMSQEEETALSGNARLIFIIQPLNLTVAADGWGRYCF